MFKGPMDAKKATTMGTMICFFYLIIHIVLLIIFYSNGVFPMFVVNICSILFYITAVIFVQKAMFRTYVIGVYLEVVIHMTLAIWFTGWSNGFQITLIGMGILLFYSEYLGRHLNVRYAPALPFSMIGMVAYLGIYLAIRHHTPQYPLPDNVSVFLEIAWGIIVFSITITFLYIFVLVSSKSEDRLADEVRHDKLTGLPNRYFMAEYLEKLSEEGTLSDYWLAMADIDDFKLINDTYGHNCGDAVLVALSRILTGGSIDMKACRWGGEEFMMIGPSHGYMQTRIRELDHLRKTVEKYDFQYEKLHLKLSITIGVAQYSEDGGTHKWITRADEKLYEGKQNGKNQVRF